MTWFCSSPRVESIVNKKNQLENVKTKWSFSKNVSVSNFVLLLIKQSNKTKTPLFNYKLQCIQRLPSYTVTLQEKRVQFLLFMNSIFVCNTFSTSILRKPFAWEMRKLSIAFRTEPIKNKNENKIVSFKMRKLRRTKFDISKMNATFVCPLTKSWISMCFLQYNHVLINICLLCLNTTTKSSRGHSRMPSTKPIFK